MTTLPLNKHKYYIMMSYQTMPPDCKGCSGRFSIICRSQTHNNTDVNHKKLASALPSIKNVILWHSTITFMVDTN